MKIKTIISIAVCLIAAGMILPAISLYHDTFISLSSCLVIQVVTGVVLTPLTFRNSLLRIKRILPIIIFFNVIVIGNAFLCTFLAINYYKADNAHPTVRKFRFVSTGMLDKGGSYVEINYKGGIKRIYFSKENTDITKFDSVQLKIIKGYLGYDVIKRVDLLR